MKTTSQFRVSSREEEVLQYISLGFTSREIARKLFLSVHTIITHKKNLVHKLQAKNQAHLIRIAMENHLINLSSRLAISA